MDPVEVEILCSGLGILAVARDCKSSGVYERCLELVQGRSNVVRLSESVRAQQKSRCTSAREGTFLDLLEEEGQTSLDGELAGEAPGLAEEERIPLAADQDDLFPVFMHEFMVHSQREAHGIAQFCRDVFTTYWELAVYFEDPGAVYPPPQESDSVEDLFVVFHRLTEAVARAASEPESLRVREELLSHGAITFAPFDEAILGPDTSSTQHGTVTSSDRQLPNKSLPKLGGAGTAKPSKIREAATGSEVLTVQRRPEMIAETSTALKSIGPTQLSVYVETMPSDPSPCRRALRTSDGHDQDDFDAVTLQRLRNIAIPHNKDDHEQSDVSDWEQTPRRVEDCGCALAEDRLKNAGHRLRRRRLLPSPPPKSSVSSTPASCVLSTPALHSSLQGPSTPSSSAPTMPVCLGSPPMWQPLFSPPGRAIGANFGVFHTPITVSLGHHLAPLEITHSGLHISESTARNMDVQALPMVAPQPSGLSKGPITKSPSLNAKQPGEHSFVAISRHMDLRRSLSMAADRVESVVLLNMSDMALLSGPDPDDKGRVVARLRPHEPPVPFAAQLEAEVKRRSVSGHDVARS